MNANIAPTALRASTSTTSRRQQTGASMIEVLVAVLLFSLGLVGMLGISVASLENNKLAQLRMTGVGLAHDYAERARMNVRGFDSGAYAIALSATAETTTVSTDPNQTAGSTAATNVASADKQVLLREVAWRLPQGDAVVKVENTPTRALHLWLLWQEPEAATNSVAADLFSKAQRNCPKDLSTSDQAKYSCMYFLVPL